MIIVLHWYCLFVIIFKTLAILKENDVQKTKDTIFIFFEILFAKLYCIFIGQSKRKKTGEYTEWVMDTQVNWGAYFLKMKYYYNSRCTLLVGVLLLCPDILCCAKYRANLVSKRDRSICSADFPFWKFWTKVMLAFVYIIWFATFVSFMNSIT